MKTLKILLTITAGVLMTTAAQAEMSQADKAVAKSYYHACVAKYDFGKNDARNLATFEATGLCQCVVNRFADEQEIQALMFVNPNESERMDADNGVDMHALKNAEAGAIAACKLEANLL